MADSQYSIGNVLTYTRKRFKLLSRFWETPLAGGHLLSQSPERYRTAAPQADWSKKFIY
jgi:hypothetical protein